MWEQETLKSVVDPTPFRGIEAVKDAVEFLHRGLNVGKVIVEL
jgi:NADPH-dependent curcumin reductase CurA